MPAGCLVAGRFYIQPCSTRLKWLWVKGLFPKAQKWFPKSELWSDVHIWKKEAVTSTRIIPFCRDAITSKNAQPGLKILPVLRADHFSAQRKPDALRIKAPCLRGQRASSYHRTRRGIVSFCHLGQRKIQKCFILSWRLEGREIIFLEPPLRAMPK